MVDKSLFVSSQTATIGPYREPGNSSLYIHDQFIYDSF